MGVESWDPQSGSNPQALQLNEDLLQQFIALAQASESGQLAELVAAEQASEWRSVLERSAADWQRAVSDYSAENIYDIMRFLTLAEDQLPGWEAGEKSPVIALNAVLKSRKQALSREQVMWIKQHSRNRFLPHGPIQL